MKLIFTLITISFCSISFAGPGHGHEHSHRKLNYKPIKMDVKKAEIIGKIEIKRLIREKKIDLSWNKAQFEKAEKKVIRKKSEWVITYLNKNGVKGKKLFIFLQPSGKFIAANFTGK